MNHLFRKLLLVMMLMLRISPNTASAQLTDKDVISFIPNTHQQVRMFWKDDNGNILGSLNRLQQYTASKKQLLIFAMNGGMYTEDRTPVGLFVKEGKTIKAINKAKGSGNFYLQPNGIFYITNDGKGHVCKTTDFIQNKNIQYATQSGPMLVINGRIHKAFKAGSTNINIRNGIGIKKDGSMLFAMSKTAVSLYDFAQYFKTQGCSNALYLDGFVSRTYYPVANWLQTDGYFGVMIGVVSR